MHRLASHAWPLGLVCLAIVIALRSVDGFYVYDDMMWAGVGNALSGLGWPAAWDTVFGPYPEGVTLKFFRPLSMLLWTLDARLFGLEYAGSWFHHAFWIAAMLLAMFGFGRALGLPKPLAGLAAVLFGLGPGHVEAYYWLSCRSDVVCATFSLISLAAYTRWMRREGLGHLLLSALCFALALSAKESAMALPFGYAIATFVVVRGGSPRLPARLGHTCFAAVPFVAVLVGYLSLRQQATGELFGGYTIGKQALVIADPAENIPAYLQVLVAPVLGTRLETWVLIAVATLQGSLFASAALCGRSVRLFRTGILFAGLWAIAASLPNLLAPAIGQDLADCRSLLMPNVGTALALALGLGAIHRNLGRFAGRLATTLTVAVFGVLSWTNAAPWITALRAGDSVQQTLESWSEQPPKQRTIIELPTRLEGAWAFEAISFPALFVPPKVQTSTLFWTANHWPQVLAELRTEKAAQREWWRFDHASNSLVPLQVDEPFLRNDNGALIQIARIGQNSVALGDPVPIQVQIDAVAPGAGTVRTWTAQLLRDGSVLHSVEQARGEEPQQLLIPTARTTPPGPATVRLLGRDEDGEALVDHTIGTVELYERLWWQAY